MKKLTLIIIVLITSIGIGSVVLGKNDKPDSASHDMANTTFGGDANSKSNEPIATDKVTIKNFAFVPAKITVKKGTKVTWINDDSAHHDVTPDQASTDFVASKLLANGESYSFTFEKPGTYAYHCSPHPYMKAMITVTE
ncbi:MAG TPA: cupredoxin family copper-binding protein [Candidatus Limnocylindrales bacterium]|nr:cupredoxin family copper-binding protein [Candidatus Limnocylindrales bacterium]